MCMCVGGCRAGGGGVECTSGVKYEKMMDDGAGGEDCFAAPN